MFLIARPHLGLLRVAAHFSSQSLFVATSVWNGDSTGATAPPDTGEGAAEGADIDGDTHTKIVMRVLPLENGKNTTKC